MSLSLQMSQTAAGNTRSRLPITQSLALDQQQQPPSSPSPSPSAIKPGSQTSGSQSRASAASRRKAASQNQNLNQEEKYTTPSPSPVPPQLTAQPSETIIPATASPEPATQRASRSSRGRASASASATATPAQLAPTLTQPLAPTPAQPASAAAAATSTRARPSAATAIAPTTRPSKPLPVDDGSDSYLTKFVFHPVEGPPREPGGTFLAWVHYTPADDQLQFILLQQSALYRCYTFTGKLTELKPMGLYMSGMKDKDYCAYVLNGLCEQDSPEKKNNYEYEFITVSEDEDAPSAAAGMDIDGDPIVRAQLKLYKQMGETTRVPVCIAHIRFDPIRISSTSGPPDRLRQDELQYKTTTSQLISALCAHTQRLRGRRAAHDAQLARQAQECKVAEELEQIPPHGDLSLSGRALIEQMVTMLNAKKALIRQKRAENGELEAQIQALKPRNARGRTKAEEDLMSDSSSSEDERAAMSDSDEEMKYGERSAHGAPEQKYDVIIGTDEQQHQALLDQRNDSVQAMELDGQPGPTAAAAAPSSLDRPPSHALISSHDSSLSFPASIEPASFGASPTTFVFSSPSLPLSGSHPPSSNQQQTPPSNTSNRSSRASTRRGGPGGASIPPPPSSGGSASGELDLSPPRVRAQVRKRARPLAAPHSPSQPSSSSRGSGGGGGGASFPSSQDRYTATAVAPLNQAAIPSSRKQSSGGGAAAVQVQLGSHPRRPSVEPPVAAAAATSARRSSRDASQLLRDLASNAQSRRANGGNGNGGGGGLNDSVSPEPQAQQQPPSNSSAGNKKQRTQPGGSTSRVLGEME